MYAGLTRYYLLGLAEGKVFSQQVDLFVMFDEIYLGKEHHSQALQDYKARKEINGPLGELMRGCAISVCQQQGCEDNNQWSPG